MCGLELVHLPSPTSEVMLRRGGRKTLFFSTDFTTTLFSFSGPAVLCHGVCQRRGLDVPDTAVRKVQGARRSVSLTSLIGGEQIQGKTLNLGRKVERND